MSIRETLVEFPGQLIRTIPTDAKVREARESGLYAVKGYQGLSRRVLMAGAFLTVVLVVLINESLPKTLGGITTVSAIIVAGATLLLTSLAAKRHHVEEMVNRHEDLSLTVVLVVIALGSAFASTPWIDMGRYWMAAATSGAVFTIGAFIITYLYINKYLADKKAVLEYLQGFEHAPTEALDELWIETENNQFLESWLNQFRYRQEPLTLHEVNLVKKHLL